MTETLAEKTCTPCRGGVPPLARDEALRFQAQAPDWELRDGAHRIERTFRFRNFREALAFVQQVGELAESEGHHPDISFGWGRATFLYAPRRSRDCTRMISSWRARSTAWPIGRVRLQPELRRDLARC
jgi:4a-hydroxytetrahydrobiopterin dehydratase